MDNGFANAIKKFDGEFPVAHLMFVMEDLGNTRGETRAPDNHTNTDSPDFVITIALNSNANEYGADYRPNLMNAKTIVHEVIHAEMYRKLLSLANQGHLSFTGWSRQQQLNYMMNIKDNFPGIYDYMRQYKNWQHQQMATHYRETMARILQKFNTGLEVGDDQTPDQFYMDLAWEGLIYEEGENAIYAWTSQSEEEKERIKNVISDYIETHNNQNCPE